MCKNVQHGGLFFSKGAQEDTLFLPYSLEQDTILIKLYFDWPGERISLQVSLQENQYHIILGCTEIVAISSIACFRTNVPSEVLNK